MFLNLTWLRVLIIVNCKVSNDDDNEYHYFCLFCLVAWQIILKTGGIYEELQRGLRYSGNKLERRTGAVHALGTLKHRTTFWQISYPPAAMMLAADATSPQCITLGQMEPGSPECYISLAWGLVPTPRLNQLCSVTHVSVSPRDWG